DAAAIAADVAAVAATGAEPTPMTRA
ncbi:MAG: hypothetical protein JWP87_2544, partial [Labilithrix sp.]|nr:hypothetical protein [Labilithrix sp.]